MVDEPLTWQADLTGQKMATLLDDIVVPTKLVMLGIVLGALSGFAVAQLSPGPTMAAVVKEPPLSVGSTLSTTLRKFDGRYFAIGTEPSVSLEPLSSATVRKIGYGWTTFVNVVTTSSGTYSTDGLISPHVRYPGVYTERLNLHFLPFAGIYGWSRLTGWTAIPLFAANSFGYLDTSEPARSEQGVCIADTETGGCR